MNVALHVVGLLGLIAVSALISVARWKERPTARRAIFSLLGGLALLLAASCSFTHLCSSGQPETQPFIGALCIIALGISVKEAKLCISACILVVVVTLALSSQYTRLVHAEGLTGNPRSDKLYERIRESRMTTIRGTVQKVGTGNLQIYSEGWLAEGPLALAHEDLRDVLKDPDATDIRLVVTPFWHSWLTRLYKTSKQRVRIWYPGGTPTDAALRLEWRDSS